MALYIPLRGGGLHPAITYTRASDAWYRQADDANGERWAAAGGNDVARIHSWDGTAAHNGLLIEPARTNYALNSQRIENAYNGWVETGSVCTDNQFTAPDGTLTAELCEDDAVGSHERIEQTGMGLPLNPCEWSIWSYDISGNTGDMRISTPGATTSHALTTNTTWTRTSVNKTPTNANTSYVRLYPGSVAAGAAGLGACAVWGMQVEEGDYVTSYIPTENAAVTRAGDVCAIAGARAVGLVSPQYGRVRFCWAPGMSSAAPTTNHQLLRLADGGDGSSCYLIFRSADQSIRLYSAGLAQATTPGLAFNANGSFFVITVWWNGAACGLEVIQDGAYAGGGVGTWTAPTQFANNNLYLGSSSTGTTQATGTYSDLYLGY